MMKRLIRISDGRDCGVYPDDHQPPEDCEEGLGLVANPPTYRFDPVPQAELDAEAKADSLRAIDAQLLALDMKRIRPAAEGDAVYLKGLNDQVAALRAQRAALTK